MSFILHQQLKQDCTLVGDTRLCKVLLMNANQFPWLIVVPKKANVTEVFELGEEDQSQLSKEINEIGERMMALYKGDKLNIGALGNLVPQLHIHVIVRYTSDAVWPKPVWGNFEPTPYTDSELEAEIDRIKLALASLLVG